MSGTWKTASPDVLREWVDDYMGTEQAGEMVACRANAALAELVRRAEEAATLRTERDRLARILAVERGDESQAPSGWIRQMDWPDWFHPDSGADVERDGDRWRFTAGAAPLQGDFASALEAMEAADKARGVRHD